MNNGAISILDTYQVPGNTEGIKANLFAPTAYRPYFNRSTGRRAVNLVLGRDYLQLLCENSPPKKDAVHMINQKDDNDNCVGCYRLVHRRRNGGRVISIPYCLLLILLNDCSEHNACRMSGNIERQ